MVAVAHPALADGSAGGPTVCESVRSAENLPIGSSTMTSDEWLAVSARALRYGTAAADRGKLDEARFWLGRWRTAAHYARHRPC